MITVKVIFIGLIAFTPVDDGGYMAVVVDAPGHHTVLLQQQGVCPDEQLCQQLSGDEDLIIPLREKLGRMLGWTPVHGELVLLNQEGEPLADGVIYAGGVPTTDDPQAPYPTTAAEAASLAWIPSIDRMVTGPARIRGACKRSDRGCRSKARFRIQQGTVSTCHLMHEERVLRPLVYDFGTHQQAVADAVMLETRVPGEEIRIGVRSLESTDVVHSIPLAPEAESNEIILVLLNEPSMPGAAPNGGKPPELGHFPHFYKLLQFFGRGKDMKPKLRPMTVPLLEDFSCEPTLVWLFNDDEQEEAFTAFPHGGTECDTARIP